MAAAAIAAGRFGACDLDLPNVWTLLEIEPSELVGITGVDLVVQGLRVVVAGHVQSAPGRERGKHAEDRRMAVARRNETDVDFGRVRGILHGVS
jgi:hypothetical protein